jgi:hypothetical protein
MPTAEALAEAAPLSSSSLTVNELAQSTSADQQQQQPSKPAQNPNEPSLSDLGLNPAQTAPDPALQARLDRHTRMLKIHQRLGLLTLIPLAATVISSGGATEGHQGAPGSTATTTGGNTVGRDLHASLGSLTVGMYAATAYYAIRAPKVSEGPARGGIRFHKYLIYIHAPGMVLTPILGAMAFDQANKGEKIHGIASAHGAVAWTTVVSYTAAVIAVSWPIHL